ncbi:phenylacetate-CoA oxygenase subunit PaaC [Nonomuraea sp. NN258]|uniref:1,2-phenylacetyl-CoA epoxidase subunit PaaC n=1 Tax=Nonomuraea antri TaxID=2730852 RepID=UPI0015692AF3|nr:1,2-phenylacetyl-CoA epoxidase subunit PaaC [Nonomuraea antri]NRQ35079.1 phenylacetate-CoA oxygenase subunit PaaC [Nonomuraea antri]
MIGALEIGDDCLVLSQRLAEWVTRAPTLEEDIALANLSLDLLGQARSLLSRAGDEDELAYLRDPAGFRNCLLVEQPNGDFAHTVVRHLLYATFLHALYADHPEDDVAAKGVKELAYHRDYARLWSVRLGRGTEESRRRMTAALESLWPYTGELFDDHPALRAPWAAYVHGVLDDSGLSAPEGGPQRRGGRRGEHEAHLTELLDELQALHREHAGATW